MPVRRCVGCGRVAPKSELLRFAAVADGADRRARAVLDRAERLPGRGAYVCRAAGAERPDRACAARASKRNALARALRRPIAGDSFSDDVKLVESVSP